MKKSLIVAILFLLHITVYGQGGVNLNAGVVVSEIGNFLFNPNGTGLYGYQIGADIRLNDGSMYFNPGLHYIRLSVEPSEFADFFGHEGDFHIIKGRFGLGFKVINISSKTTLRAKGLGAINYVMKTDSKFKELYPNQTVNDAFAGIDLGLGLDIYALTIDIEYELGLVNMINKVENSTMNMWRFSLGVFF